MLTLGIESSCDETSVAVVRDGRYVLSNVIASQIELHRATGGVVPEVAAREHVVKIIPVIDEALKKAGITLKEIDLIAATAGPGLLSSLLIGLNAGVTLAHVLQKPIVGVNHIEGHMYANWLDQETLPQFPLVVLTASGGHNELVLWENHGKYRMLGATLDDAAGEAFDKVARLLGLPYPGGPSIQKAAQNGNPHAYELPRAWVTEWDFSFSGLKTAVRRIVDGKRRTKKFVSDVAASFQASVCEVLATKLAKAAVEFGAREAHLAGGVSANSELRAWTKRLLPASIPLRFCTHIRLCTDNAAMIACAGYYRFTHSREKFSPTKIPIASPNFEVVSWN